jgi:ActR/RegA family two-component response regulator
MSQDKNKVLVIEDNKEHMIALSIKLKAHNYDVVWAGDGVTAMTVATREKPDAILLDLGLPGGDGLGPSVPPLEYPSSLSVHENPWLIDQWRSKQVPVHFCRSR